MIIVQKKADNETTASNTRGMDATTQKSYKSIFIFLQSNSCIQNIVIYMTYYYVLVKT